MITRHALAAVLLLAGAAAVEAQSAPPISAPKNAARRAVAKANARTEAQQNVDAATPSAPRPAAPRPAAPRPAASRAGGQPAAGAAAQSNAAQSNAAQSNAAPAGPAQAAPGAAPKPTLAIADTGRGARSTSVAERGGRNEVTFRREVYGYDAGGRRDPFVSLLASGDLRPILSDLRLVAVAYDPTGRNSVAVMRDASTKDQYRVKVGQTLGRMRVAQIQPKSVTFTIEEFGYSRREELVLGDSTTVRTQ